MFCGRLVTESLISGMNDVLRQMCGIWGRSVLVRISLIMLSCGGADNDLLTLVRFLITNYTLACPLIRPERGKMKRGHYA